MNAKGLSGALVTTAVVGWLLGASGIGVGYAGPRAMGAANTLAAMAASPENEPQVPADSGLSPNTVEEAQEQLRGAGFNPGPATGTMDVQTREAIRMYQSVKGLPVSGELDEDTLTALRREAVRA
ncbi:MAG: peptidoglycan-binding domain-containing protein, partial [Candidatus Methylomirabilales bacterium]